MIIIVNTQNQNSNPDDPAPGLSRRILAYFEDSSVHYMVCKRDATAPLGLICSALTLWLSAATGFFGAPGSNQVRGTSVFKRPILEYY